MSNSRESYSNYSSKELRLKDSLFANFIANKIITIPESLNFGAIFILHLNAALLSILFNTPLHYVLFPIAAGASIAKAGLAWHRYYLARQMKQDEGRALIHALWESLTAFGITAGVVTGIIANFIVMQAVGVGIAATFAGLLGASTVYLALQFTYDVYKVRQAQRALGDDMTGEAHMTYKKHLRSAKINLFFTCVVAALCIGLTLSMLAGFPLVGGIIGGAACLAGAAYAAYDLYRDYKTYKVKKDHEKIHLLELEDLERVKGDDGTHRLIRNTLSSDREFIIDAMDHDDRVLTHPIAWTEPTEPANAPPHAETAGLRKRSMRGGA